MQQGETIWKVFLLVDEDKKIKMTYLLKSHVLKSWQNLQRGQDLLLQYPEVLV